MVFWIQNLVDDIQQAPVLRIQFLVDEIQKAPSRSLNLAQVGEETRIRLRVRTVLEHFAVAYDVGQLDAQIVAKGHETLPLVLGSMEFRW